MPLFYQKLPDNTIFLCIISRVPHYKIFHVKNEFQSQKITIKKIRVVKRDILLIALLFLLLHYIKLIEKNFKIL